MNPYEFLYKSAVDILKSIESLLPALDRLVHFEWVTKN